jgi:hypothetical protein
MNKKSGYDRFPPAANGWGTMHPELDMVPHSKLSRRDHQHKKKKELNYRASHTGFFPKHKTNRILPSDCPVWTLPYDPGAFQYQASVIATRVLGSYAVQGQTRKDTIKSPHIPRRKVLKHQTLTPRILT